MTRARLALLFSLLLLLLLPACSSMEPVDGCLLAAANRREVLRAQAYLHPAIPARILLLRSADGRAGHAALVCRLDPEGWVVYDDNYGSRPLRVAWPDARTFPPAWRVAREAFPGWPIGQAWWMPPALTASQGE